MRTHLWIAALAATLLPLQAVAAPGASGGLLLDPAPAAPFVSVASAVPATATPALSLATPFVGGIGYRPRSYRSHESVMPVTTQLHLGFFDPGEGFSTGFVGGFRMGPQVDPHVQIGVGMDWWHRSESTTMDLGPVPVPAGAASERLVLEKASADLMPLLAFVQVSGDENLPVIPYGGFGAGYEWLFLSSDNYYSDESWDQTFGGFGWQVWGGAGIPLDGRVRINGEVFYNVCEVGSDLDIPLGDRVYTVRDVIKMNGAGMRFGISWGF
jgi:hypothetical protein